MSKIVRTITLTISLALSAAIPNANAEAPATAPGKSAKSMQSAQPAKSAKTARRVLQFPDKNVGNLMIFPPGYFPTKELNTADPAPIRSIPAMGRVEIEADRFVLFKPHPQFYIDPSCINKLPVDAFDKVDLQFLPMDDADEGRSQKALAALTRLTGLRFLCVDRSDLNDKDLAIIAKFPNLIAISTYAAPVDGSFLQSVTNLKKLRVVTLGNNALNRDAFKSLANFPALEWLRFDRGDLEDQDLAAIAECQNVRSLCIAHNKKLTPAGVAKLAKLQKLKNLDIRGVPDIVGCLMPLKNLHLAYILINRSLSRSELEELRKAHKESSIIADGGGKEAKVKDYGEIFAPITREKFK